MTFCGECSNVEFSAPHRISRSSSLSTEIRMLSIVGLSNSGALPGCSVSTSSSQVGVSLGTSRSRVTVVSKKWRKYRVSSSGSEEQQNSPTSTESEDLSAKLAAAEAEAEALKKELALRRAGSRAGDLSKLKPATPEKRIDGTGFRETIFTVPNQTKAASTKKWGLSEAELFLSKGAPTEGAGLQGSPMEEGADQIITRRLIGGVVLTVVALGLAFVKLPVLLGKPSKPLFLYVTYIVRLREALDTLEATGSDPDVVASQLRIAYGSPDELKNNFLSTAALLDAGDVDKANTLSYEIFDYLFQANPSKYFDQLSTPSPGQKAEFLKFSFKSIGAARSRVDEILRLVPEDVLSAAKLQLVS